MVKRSCLVALILVQSQSRKLLHKKQIKVFSFFPHLFFTLCISMKAIRIFNVLYKPHFWLRLCSRRPGPEPGYLRYILHIRHRNSLLFHHGECPRAIFYLGTFTSYTCSCNVTVPLKFWDFQVISVCQRHEDICSAQILLTAKSTGSFHMDPPKSETHQTKHTNTYMLCK